MTHRMHLEESKTQAGPKSASGVVTQYFGRCTCGIETPRTLVAREVPASAPIWHKRIHPRGVSAVWEG